MRQQEIRKREAFDIVEAPHLKPAAEAMPQPAAAIPHMPKAAGGMIIAASYSVMGAVLWMIAVYAALIGTFVVTIHGARADFEIVIAAFYLMMFFAVPAIFL